MLLIAERGKRNNNPHALQTWCEAVDKWEALEDDDLMESVFGFEWKWGLG